MHVALLLSFSATLWPRARRTLVTLVTVTKGASNFNIKVARRGRCLVAARSVALWAFCRRQNVGPEGAFLSQIYIGLNMRQYQKYCARRGSRLHSKTRMCAACAQLEIRTGRLASLTHVRIVPSRAKARAVRAGCMVLLTLTRALRARRARPPEAPEKAPYLAALQPRAQRA